MKSWHAFKERFYVAKKYQPTLIAKLTLTHIHMYTHGIHMLLQIHVSEQTRVKIFCAGNINVYLYCCVCWIVMHRMKVWSAAYF